jgi:streptogramin lyase
MLPRGCDRRRAASGATAGVVTNEFCGLSSLPFGITTGPDGALWFTKRSCCCDGDAIGIGHGVAG